MRRHFLTLILLLVAVAASAFKADTVTVASKYLDTPMKVTVLTPDGAAGQRFPTVYLLNGFSGDYRAWTQTTEPRLGEIADRYGMVFVMPDGRDSWYWDSPVNSGLQMESFITKTLVPYIDSKFPTIPEVSKRAITGLSMGGHGSIYLAARHPEIFGSAGSMSGGVDIRPFPKSWNMSKLLGKTYAEDAPLWDSHTVATMVPQIKKAGINLIFDCGSEDFFAKVNADFHHALLDAGVPHDYTSRPGNHSHSYWRNSLKYHLLYFNEVFKKK